YGQSYLMAAVGERVMATLRRALYLHIQGMPLSFFSDRHSADLMSRVITDVNRLARVSSTVLVMVVRQVAMVAALVTVMFVREWRLAVIALLVFPFIGVAVRAIGRRLYRINKRSQEKIAELNVRQLSRIVNTVQQSTGSVERVFEVLDTPPAIADRPGAHALTMFTESLALEGVSFRYPGAAEPTLRDINLTARRGEVVAFVGMS